MDLYWAATIIALLATLSLLTGLCLGRHSSRHVRIGVQISVLLLGTGYFLFIWDRPILTRLLPHASLIVLSNWHSLFGCFFAGMLLASVQVKLLRRSVIGTAAVLISGYSIIAPLAGQSPDCAADVSSEPFVSQSTPFTCSPAAGASLLRLHGIQVSEAEMADLCLTRKGTHWLGLYRGLKMMTQHSAWDVTAEPFSIEAVRQLKGRPAILSVNVGSKMMNSTLEHGFNEESGHSVLALGVHEHLGVMVFDPSPNYGIESWNDAILNRINHGVVLTLEPREDGNVEPVIATKLTIPYLARTKWRLNESDVSMANIR